MKTIAPESQHGNGPERLLTAREVADRLAIGETTVNSMARRRRFAFIKVGKERRFKSADIEAYLARQTIAAWTDA